MDTDFVWKLIVGGNGNVGKTTLLYRFIKGDFIENLMSTVGVQFHSHVFDREGKLINLVLWDLGGQDRFRVIHEDYLRGASGGIVCFDLTSMQSLKGCVAWIDTFRKVIPSLPILLVGTKLDLVDSNQNKLIFKMANLMTLEKSLHGFIQTSSKQGINVDQAINSMIDIIYGNLIPSEIPSRFS